MLEKWQDRGYGYTKPSVHDMPDYASKLAVDTSMKCTSKCLGSGDDWNVRHLDNNGNWFGCICAAYLTYAIAADKRNQNEPIYIRHLGCESLDR